MPLILYVICHARGYGVDLGGKCFLSIYGRYATSTVVYSFTQPDININMMQVLVVRKAQRGYGTVCFKRTPPTFGRVSFNPVPMSLWVGWRCWEN